MKGVTVNLSDSCRWVGQGGWQLLRSSVVGLLGLLSCGVSAGAELTALGWGLDDSGQLGLGSPGVFETPTALPSNGPLAGKTVIKSVASGNHVLVVTADQKVFAWGSNVFGQLGNGTRLPSSQPVEVFLPEGLAGKAILDAGVTSNACYLVTADFELWGWGNGAFGGGNSQTVVIPVRINAGVLAGKRVVKIACGISHLIALTEDGLVAAMGVNSFGQLGDNTTTQRFSPVAVVDTNGVLAGRTVVHLAAVESSSVAMTSDGVLLAWGRNSAANLGLGDQVARWVPTLVEGSLTGRVVSAVAISASKGYAITTDNTLHCWGGYVGIETVPGPEGVVDTRRPSAAVMSVFEGETLVEVASGSQFGAVRTASGGVFTWGSRVNGRLGRAGLTGRVGAVGRVSLESLGAGAAVASLGSDGVQRVSAILTDGRLVHWGRSTLGRVGDGGTYWRASPVTLPVSTLPANEGWRHLVARNRMTLGVSTSGKVYAWGEVHSGVGELFEVFTEPRRVRDEGLLDDEVVTMAATSGDHFVALTQNGEAYTWGAGWAGQLGDGVFHPLVQHQLRKVVTAGTLMAGKKISQIAVGTAHTLVLTENGGLFSWGWNSLGQLGDATLTNRSLPTAVLMNGALAGKTVVAIAASGTTSFALTEDGLVFSWGSHQSGLLGTGGPMYAYDAQPKMIKMDGAMAGKRMVHISAGSVTAYAIAEDGTLFGWGSYTDGLLGEGVSNLNFSNQPIRIELPAEHAHRVPESVVANNGTLFVLTRDGMLFGAGTSRYGALGVGVLEENSTPVLRPVEGTRWAPGFKIKSVSTSGASGHVVALAEPSVPEWEVEHPVGSLWSNHLPTVHFEPTPPNVEVQQTVRFRYTSEADLTGLVASVQSDGDVFSIVNPPASVLPGGQVLDLVIAFRGSAPGQYRGKLTLVADDAGLEPLELDLRAHVLGPVPWIVTPPRGRIVSEGATVTFAVEALGLPPLTYQWRYRGRNLPGANSATLELQTVSLDQAGDYSVVVRSRSAVQPPPAHLAVVRFAAGSQHWSAGSATTFSLKASGTRLTHQWLKDGLPLPMDARFRGSNTPTLRIAPLAADDTLEGLGHGGVYSCRVSRVGSESYEAGEMRLVVTDFRPKFTQVVALPPAAIGEDYRFAVQMEDLPWRWAHFFRARGLPLGLTIDPGTGVIRGQPRQVRADGFTVEVTAGNLAGWVSHRYQMQVRPLPAAAFGRVTAVMGASEPLNQHLGGRMDMNITETGAFSGSVVMGLSRYSVRGSVTNSQQTGDVTGTAIIPRRGGDPLELRFRINANQTPELTGQVQDPKRVGATASLRGWQVPWSAQQPATLYAGMHQVLLQPPTLETEDPDLPRGQGFASFTPSRLGRIRLVGKLADGQGFAVSSVVGAGGQAVIHQLLYRGPWRGSLNGRMVVDLGLPELAPQGNRVQGDLNWTRPADLGGRSLIYPSGFQRLALEIKGSGYAPVPNGTLLGLPLAEGMAEVMFTAAKATDLPTSPAIQVRLQERDRVLVLAPNPAQTSFQTDVKRGRFRGEFRLMDGGVARRARFEGAVIQAEEGAYGAGYFLLPELGSLRPLTLSGEVLLRQVDPLND